MIWILFLLVLVIGAIVVFVLKIMPSISRRNYYNNLDNIIDDQVKNIVLVNGVQALHVILKLKIDKYNYIELSTASPAMSFCKSLVWLDYPLQEDLKTKYKAQGELNIVKFLKEEKCTRHREIIIKNLYLYVPKINESLVKRGYVCAQSDVRQFMELETDSLLYLSPEGKQKHDEKVGREEKNQRKKGQDREEDNKKKEQKKQEERNRKEDHRRKEEKQKNGGHTSFSNKDIVEWSYAILNLKRGASFDDVKKAYRTLAKEFHPDRISGLNLNDEYLKFATKKFQEIEEAYSILQNHFQ